MALSSNSISNTGGLAGKEMGTHNWRTEGPVLRNSFAVPDGRWVPWANLLARVLVSRVAHGFSRGGTRIALLNSCPPPLKRWATHQKHRSLTVAARLGRTMTLQERYAETTASDLRAVDRPGSPAGWVLRTFAGSARSLSPPPSAGMIASSTFRIDRPHPRAKRVEPAFSRGKLTN